MSFQCLNYLNRINKEEKVYIFKCLFETVVDIFNSKETKKVRSKVKQTQEITVFTSDFKEENDYEISYFVYRLVKKHVVSTSVLISAFILLDKLISSTPNIISRKFIKFATSLAIILSQKFLDDEVYEDKDYAKTLNISIKLFSAIESSFLKLINYELFIPETDFAQYCDYLNRKIKTERKSEKDNT